jgi:hypothetical protein
MVSFDNTTGPSTVHAALCVALCQAVCTRWGSDPFTFGSYSSVAVGSEGPLDYDIMAEPLANRVFFAGRMRGGDVR